jgi:hypothetical protein
MLPMPPLCAESRHESHSIPNWKFVTEAVVLEELWTGWLSSLNRHILSQTHNRSNLHSERAQLPR